MCCRRFVWLLFFFKQKSAYELRISDWSSDVCSSDLRGLCGHDQIGLIVFAIGSANLDLRLVGQRGGDIFDRAANSVAAIERAQIGRASCRERVCQYV